MVHQVSNMQGRPLKDADDLTDVTFRDRIVHFTWSWFACTMSTGAIAILLAAQPFPFRGLRTIGKVFFILDLVLFLTFCALIATRFILHPKALSKSLHHPTESFFFGAFLVSIVLIINCMQQYGVPTSGTWLVKTLEVLFWGYSGIALLVVVFQYHVIFDLETLPVKEAIPGWILPAYPFLVLGPLAAAISESQPPQSALNIWVAGVVFQGLGWTLAFLMYTLYFTRLVASKLPSPPQRPGMYVAVGPASYTAQGIINLALNAPDVIPEGFLGISTLPVGDLFKAFGIPIGIFIWAIGFWFFAVGTVSIISGSRQMKFTLNLWALIFPNSGLALALIAIGNAVDSDGIRGVAAGLTIILVITWVVVAIFNIRAVIDGNVLWPGKDEDGGNVENRVMLGESDEEKQA